MGQVLTLKNLVRAGAVAVALAASAVAALPAEAAPPHMHMHMHGYPHFGHPFWPGYGFGFGFGAPWYGGYWGYYPQPYPGAVCMTDWQVRSSLAARGYSNILLSAPRGRVIGARAVSRGWLYALQVDRCTGAIISAHRLRRY